MGEIIMRKISIPKTLRENHMRSVFRCFLMNEEITATDLQARTSLSTTTLPKILAELVEEGMILQTTKKSSPSEGGRPAMQYVIQSNYAFFIAFQIFTDKLVATLIGFDREIILSSSVTILPDINFDSLLENINVLVQTLLEQSGLAMGQIHGIAVGTHGITSLESKIEFSPHFPNIDPTRSLKKELKKNYPTVEVVLVDNQIRFQAIAEVTFGCAILHSKVVVIEGGDGLVAGIISDGKLERGSNNLIGEIGHMKLDPDAKLTCSCSAKGCFEAMVSFQHLLNLAQEAVRANPSTILAEKGNLLTVEDVFRANKVQDTAATAVMKEIARWFALGIGNTILLHDPSIVVLQGGYEHAGQDFLKQIRCSLKEEFPVLGNHSFTLEYSQLGKSRSALGAGVVLVEEYSNQMFQRILY